MAIIRCNTSSGICIAIIAICAIISYCSALECYNCATVYDTDEEVCNNWDGLLVNNTEYITPCNDTIHHSCMKIVTVRKVKGEGDVEPQLDEETTLTSRMCSSVDEGGCDKLYTANGIQTTCYCTDDLCNTASVPHTHTLPHTVWLCIMAGCGVLAATKLGM